jgi:hypothetical protein
VEARSRIIRPRESLVLYKSFKTLWSRLKLQRLARGLGRLQFGLSHFALPQRLKAGVLALIGNLPSSEERRGGEGHYLYCDRNARGMPYLFLLTAPAARVYELVEFVHNHTPAPNTHGEPGQYSTVYPYASPHFTAIYACVLNAMNRQCS